MRPEKHGTSSLSVERVWKQFGQMFGTRWAEQFGPNPNDEWIGALGDLRPDQIRRALSKIRVAPLPYPGWLPSMPEFLAFARSIHVMPTPKPEPSVSIWLDAVNRLFFIWIVAEIKAGRRRIVGSKQLPCSIPDEELQCRRFACRRLAEDFEAMEREGDPQTNREWLRQAFKKQMELIPVRNPL